MSEPKSKWNVPWFHLGGLCVVTISSLLLLKRLKAKRALAKSNRLKLADQVERDESLLREERKIFSGIRVVDIATHIAAPSAARVLGDLGAEVIKVEVPSGDLLRNVLLAFEKPRVHHGTVFENQNLSKFGASIDLKTDDGRAQLHELLKSADVLITNTRGRSLEQLGLDYKSISKAYPQLVYALVSAWGRSGADAMAPGYDIGAYWSIGMASQVSDQGQFSTYPGAMGDQTTAQYLLGSIASALSARLETGKGCFVESSLVHVGLWTLAARVVEEDALGKVVKDHSVPDYDDRPARNVVDEIYTTKDGAHVAITYRGSFESKGRAEESLEDALDLPHQATYDMVSERVGCLSLSVVEEKLGDVADIHVDVFVDMLEKWEKVDAAFRDEDYAPEHGLVDATPNGYDDVDFSPRIPQEFSACKHHGPLKSAPKKGEHNECIFRSKWLNKKFNWPSVQVQEGGKQPCELPLSNTVVVELSDIDNRHDVAVSVTGKVLLEAGASVYVANPAKGLDAAIGAFLEDGKVVSSLEMVPALLQSAHVLVTDFGDEELASLGVSPEAYPKLVIVQLTPGPGQSRNHKGAFTALDSAWLSTGLAKVMGGHPAQDIRRYPEHALETTAAGFLYSAAAIGVFHLRHTGKGQVISVSYERIGHWLSQLNSVFVLRDRAQVELAYFDKSCNELRTPLPLYASHKSKDGMWIQFLGLDTARHVPKFLSAFKGLKFRVYLQLLYAVLFKIIPNFREPNLLQRVLPAFITLNTAIEDVVAQHTYDELREIFHKHDIWYTPIRVPAQLLDYQQLWDNNMLVKKKGGGITVTAPIGFSF